MAVVAGVLSERQKRTLEALCDTWVPAVDPDGSDPVEASFLARPATDIGVADQIEGLMADAMTPDEIAATAELLDALADQDFATQPLDARADMVSATAASSFDARHGLHALKGLTLMFFYALPDEQGLNPNWEALGYPGPNSPAPSADDAPKTIRIEDVSGPSARLTADVCVVGLGGGRRRDRRRLCEGGAVGARARDGRLPQRGGLQPARDPGHVRALPRRRPADVRGRLDRGARGVDARRRDGRQLHELHQDAAAHPRRVGASTAWTGIDAPDYERDHIDAVSERLGTNTEMTRQNGTHQLLMQGLDALGLEHRPIVRNAAPTDDPEFCGYCSMGCQHGCKRSTMKTWLQDASDAGARCVVQCRADRVLTEGRPRCRRGCDRHAR